MASLDRSLSTFVYPHSRSMDEQYQWLSFVRDRILKENLNHESHNEVSIFIVPKALTIISPSCYNPQHVALGPNHYGRQELHDMEGYKIAAAKRVQRELQLQNLNFEHLVTQFNEKHEADIRACYQRFIYFENIDLVWVMAIDTAFLLEFLLVMYSKKVGKERKQAESTSNTATGSLAGISIHIAESTSKEVPTEAHTLPLFMHVHQHDYARSTSVRNTFVRDIVMLENQIPLFLLREMLKYRFSTSEESEINNMLHEMLKAFHRKFCPFKSIKDLEKATVSQRAHLLDYMYGTILPEDEQTSELVCDIEDQSDENKSMSFQNVSEITTLLSKIKELLTRVSLAKKLKSLSNPLKAFVNIAMVVVCKLKGEGSSVGSDGDCKKPPEIKIPSATELARVGVRFSPIEDGQKFRTIRFDAKKAMFYLPTVKFDANTEVILRNLVAYEASRHRSLYFTRYTELMNGIIDTAEDVRLLKESHIVQNHLKSDEEAAKMWNGMSISIKRKKVSDLDEVIRNVNKYYNSRWTIKAERFLRLYVYGSWQFLTFMAAILLLLLELFEAFCSVYDCNRPFHFK